MLKPWSQIVPHVIASPPKISNRPKTDPWNIRLAISPPFILKSPGIAWPPLTTAPKARAIGAFILFLCTRDISVPLKIYIKELHREALERKCEKCQSWSSSRYLVLDNPLRPSNNLLPSKSSWNQMSSKVILNNHVIYIQIISLSYRRFKAYGILYAMTT